MLPNVLTVLIIAAIVLGASRKIIIDKKNGVQCPGCPQSKVAHGGCCSLQSGSHRGSINKRSS
jgi:hypothetical protein